MNRYKKLITTIKKNLGIPEKKSAMTLRMEAKNRNLTIDNPYNWLITKVNHIQEELFSPFFTNSERFVVNECIKI